jgi:hypothetical protein
MTPPLLALVPQFFPPLADLGISLSTTGAPS